MVRYKVYFDNRVITLSTEPDRLQKYSLFHKYHEKTQLYNQISQFVENQELISLNVFSTKIDSLWNTFCGYFVFVEAAGGLVKHESGKYLFIKRYGRWDIPKGHIEPGETPEACALREVTEECNIMGHSIEGPLPPSYHTYLYDGRPHMKKTHWFSMRYSGKMITEPQAEEGITHAEWLAPGEIAKIRENTFISLMDLLYHTMKVR